MKETIIQYLKDTYHPRAILLYGSYRDGLNDASSDFDCMCIVEKKEYNHDHNVVAGVLLDCYLFTMEEVSQEDVEPFITAYDAEIVWDDGIGANLKKRVIEYVKAQSVMDDSEREFIISWLKKSCVRMRKNDDEAHYRAVAVLAESLADYFLLRNQYYFGSKKSVISLKKQDPKGYELYHDAIVNKSIDEIIIWVDYLTDLTH